MKAIKGWSQPTICLDTPPPPKKKKKKKQKKIHTHHNNPYIPLIKFFFGGGGGGGGGGVLKQRVIAAIPHSQVGPLPLGRSRLRSGAVRGPFTGFRV